MKNLTAVIITSLSVLIFSLNTISGETRIWNLAGFSKLKMGEPDGSRISSTGVVSAGLRARQISMDKNIAMIWCSIKDRHGKIYAGTGYDGKIYRVDKNVLTLIASTGDLIITSMVFDKKGDLYAGAIPGGNIWKIKSPSKIKKDKPIKAEKWITLPESAHIWSLAIKGKTIFAATGPHGKLFAAGPDKKVHLYLSTDEEHLLDLVLDRNQNLFAGTSPHALLLRVDGPGRAVALHDFDATEVKRVVTDEKGIIYAAVNKYQSYKIKDKSTTLKKDKKSIKNLIDKKKRNFPVDCSIYAVEPDGNTSEFYTQEKINVLSLALGTNGILYAGLGKKGQIVSIDKNRVVHNELNLDKRQIMTLLASKTLDFAGTSDAGAAYLVSKSKRGDAHYLSPILDTSGISRFGLLKVTHFKNIKIRVRTGNTNSPDKTWSAWSRVLNENTPATKNTARYLQAKISLDIKNSYFKSLFVSFVPANKKAVILEITAENILPKKRGRYNRSQKRNKAKSINNNKNVKISTQTTEAFHNFKESEILLKWKMNNPDEDKLRYRLYYKNTKMNVFAPITREDEIVTKTSYTWNTESVPEGYYEVKLTADDSLSNSPSRVLADEFISVPVLVDNHKPEITNLKFDGKSISGVAKDNFSEISQIEFSMDFGPWTILKSNDGIFDEKEEQFKLSLSSHITPGVHSIGFKASDRFGNVGTGQLLFTKK